MSPTLLIIFLSSVFLAHSSFSQDFITSSISISNVAETYKRISDEQFVYQEIASHKVIVLSLETSGTIFNAQRSREKHVSNYVPGVDNDDGYSFLTLQFVDGKPMLIIDRLSTFDSRTEQVKTTLPFHFVHGDYASFVDGKEIILALDTTSLKKMTFLQRELNQRLIENSIAGLADYLLASGISVARPDVVKMDYVDPIVLHCTQNSIRLQMPDSHLRVSLSLSIDDKAQGWGGFDAVTLVN